MFYINFFEASDGSKPVEEFLLSLDPQMRTKIMRNILHLKNHGPMLRRPYSAHLKDGIFELRTQFSNNITRILYFFYLDKNIILTNGFTKKTQKTPSKEIERALHYRNIYLSRKEP